MLIINAPCSGTFSSVTIQLAKLVQKNTMKKLLITLIACMSSAALSAEDVLQVLPFTATAGVVTEDDSFEIRLSSTNDYKAVQFDLYLPEGLTLDMDYAFDLGERCPVVGTGKKAKEQHEASVTLKNDVLGHYFVEVHPKLDATIEVFTEVQEDPLLYLYYIADAAMKPGVYPIRITGTVLGIDGNHGIYPEASVSFVTIQSQDAETESNTILDLGDDMIPSFVEDALPAQNVIRNGVCDNLVLADGYNFVTGGDFCATSATYTRPLVATWGTLCLPFALNSDETVQYYKLVSASDEAMTFEPVTTVEAGEPVVFKSLSGDVLGIHAGDVTVTEGSKTKAQEANGWTMRGTYTAFDNNPAECGNAIYYIADNRFWFADQTFRVGAFRGWFEAPEAVGEKTRAFTIFEGENPTEGVEYVEHADGSVSIVYDLSGRHRRAPQRGINIHNDKKIIKR